MNQVVLPLNLGQMMAALVVDMETATTFAIAKKFSRKAIGLLNLSDYIISGDTFYSRNDNYEALETEVDSRIREIALHLFTLDT
ncbi:hypothetical protein [Virgibacillus alimentarius]|uniref:hypothetical protein n=1 Tax=Virgibacillus alimentarius TaxID=698769 RepID=UPI0004932115|nr:hypothetical protein [Virgibacillus alimentarius]